jgi:hypothetical protein
MRVAGRDQVGHDSRELTRPVRRLLEIAGVTEDALPFADGAERSHG